MLGEQPTSDASYHVAKLPLDFSLPIERKDLKVRYGEGFGGAPLRLPPATHRVVTTGAETSSDEPTQAQGSRTVGGKDPG